MKFVAPQIIWLLLAGLPALAAFLFWTWRAKQKLIAQFVQSRLLANLTVGVSQARQKVRLVLLVLAVGLVLLALARPQWGFEWEEARQRGLDILVAIDTSRSMLAEDAKPNRLGAARRATYDLMRYAKSDRLGLIAFAGRAFLQCPLTLHEAAFRQSLDTFGVGLIPQGGTAVAEAVDTAVAAFEKNSDNHKVLVIFTDGEDHDSGALAAAEKAAKAGLKIFTIGVGTGEGEFIRQPDSSGTMTFLKDEQGNVVKSRLDEPFLQKIAATANGFYLPLRGARPIETLYERGLAPLPKSDSTTKLVRTYRERYHWPLAAAIMLLIAEMFLPNRRRVRRSELIASAENTALRQAVTAAVLLASSIYLQGSSASALKDYDQGRYRDALSGYEKLIEYRKDDIRLLFNAGDAAYRSKELLLAQRYFTDATASPDLRLQEQAYYNLGNTLFGLGEPQEDLEKKKAAWEQSIQNFENALKLDPKDADAIHNLAFVKKKLEELKKQQEQQQKQQKNQKDQSKKRRIRRTNKTRSN